jgi:hypothetical protein
VFVHGFTGHPVKTWLYTGGGLAPKSTTSEARRYSFRPILSRAPKAKKSPVGDSSIGNLYWPKELLCATLPNARILTYGYDTNLEYPLGTPRSQKSIHEFAKDFLLELEAERRNDTSRRILFIAHSLGGIIVKEMLRQSYSHLNFHIELRRNIATCTSGIIFFGTPHAGTDPTGWRRTIVESIARVAGISWNNAVAGSLLPSSERLIELRNEFRRIAQAESWMIHSFQEGHGSPELKGKKVGVTVPDTIP